MFQLEQCLSSAIHYKYRVDNRVPQALQDELERSRKDLEHAMKKEDSTIAAKDKEIMQVRRFEANTEKMYLAGFSLRPHSWVSATTKELPIMARVAVTIIIVELPPIASHSLPFLPRAPTPSRRR